MLDKLSEQPMPGKRALIVISNGKSTRANGYLSRTEERLHKAGVETFLFDGVMPNPTVGNVDAGRRLPVKTDATSSWHWAAEAAA